MLDISAWGEEVSGLGDFICSFGGEAVFFPDVGGPAGLWIVGECRRELLLPLFRWYL